jgi:type IV pilus assembly protein PilA
MKKMNNKGFSLVELIIVIAIMAVLIAVLAPQYLKYVEKSRISADGQTMDEFVSALQVLCSDPDVDLDLDTAGTKYKVSWNSSTEQLDISADLKTELTNAGIMDTSKTYKLKSKKFTSYNPSVDIKWDGNVWVLEKNLPDVNS